MIDKKSFKKAFARPFQELGCPKRGQSWYIDKGRDSIIVVSLQKSDWSNLYYVNVGILLKALSDELFPSENQCHLSFRLEDLFPNMRELISSSCDLDKGNEELLSRLSTFLAEQVIPFLVTCTDLGHLREYFPTRFDRKGFIRADAERYLLQSNSQA